MKGFLLDDAMCINAFAEPCNAMFIFFDRQISLPVDISDQHKDCICTKVDRSEAHR
jgi:hypothetical protein